MTVSFDRDIQGSSGCLPDITLIVSIPVAARQYPIAPPPPDWMDSIELFPEYIPRNPVEKKRELVLDTELSWDIALYREGKGR